MSWTATGGAIQSDGVFTAGEAVGEYAVTAATDTQQASTVVIVSKDAVPPPPPEREKPGPTVRKLTRFHGTVTLASTRVGRDASKIADEVIAHLAGLVGADVQVTLEIAATIPQGAPENVVRTATENSRQLKFTSQGFEEE